MGQLKGNTVMICGKLHPPKTLIFRAGAGTAKSGNGVEYELSTSVSTSTPVVCSKATGRWFTLSWTDIVNMARDAGIDEPEPAPEKKPKKKKRGK